MSRLGCPHATLGEPSCRPLDESAAKLANTAAVSPRLSQKLPEPQASDNLDALDCRPELSQRRTSLVKILVRGGW